MKEREDIDREKDSEIKGKRNSKKSKKKKKKHIFLKICLVLLAIIIILVGMAAGYIYSRLGLINNDNLDINDIEITEGVDTRI